MVVDWDEAEPMGDEDDGEPEDLKQRLMKRFTRFLPIKT